MKKLVLITLSLIFVFAFCSCGGDPEPTSYSPSDIQVEKVDGDCVYSVIYSDIDNSTTDQWSGYDTKEIEVQTAIEGIKACMQRDDWTDNSIVFGYAGEAKLKNALYSYGTSGYDVIDLYQIGVYNDSYTLQGELDQ